MNSLLILLTVSNFQFQSLGEPERTRFIEFLLTEVREKHVLETTSDLELKNRISDIVEEAKSFEIIFEDDIEQYTYLKFRYPKFQEKPYPQDVYDILTYPDRTPEVKFEEIIYYFEMQDHGEQ
jgi:hypothetical protein